MCLTGCGKNTKYKMLNFFFTGVPTPEEIERQKKEAEEKRKKKEAHKKPSAIGLAKIAEVPSKDKEAALKRSIYTHTPYANGNCIGCHSASSASFTMFRSNGSSSNFRKGGGKPGVLIAPRKKLCIKCHEYLTPDQASLSGLWLHTTAAVGDCDACHAPHQSGYPNVLLSKPEEICLECHSDENTLNIPDHSKPGECLDCHNPHLGRNRLLLKKDYQEKQRSERQKLDSPGQKSSPAIKEEGTNSQSNTEILKSGDSVGSGK